MKKITIAFDVNGTLTREPVRKLMEGLDHNKCHVIVWSSLGEAYAQTFCKKYGLVADEYLHKDTVAVDIAVDDVPDSVTSADLFLRVE